MKIKISALLFLILFLFAGNSRAIIPHPDHILIVIMENHGYSQIIGSSNAPYINSLVADPKGALFTNSHGLTHPSQPNYLMLYSGSNQGVTGDGLPAVYPMSAMNLGASLINAGKTFVGYSEDQPSVGYNGTISGSYVRKHNPWVNWQTSATNGYPITVNQPLTAYPTDLSLLPAVSFVIPNLLNDMHDGTVAQGDAWLQAHIGPYVTWAKTHNSLLILTFDEDNNTSPNQIPTIFVGEKVLAGSYNELINHYNILRTIEDIHGLPFAGASNTANPITDCWIPATGIINNSIPENFKLEQNYPNPFNPSTVVRFSIPTSGLVSLKVYDSLGKEVSTLVSSNMSAGNYKYDFNGSDLSSGIYHYTLSAENFTQTRTMMLIK
ncbi:hypothetical protein BH10BAC5_BH10BAC5_23500 [soil metagenome]